LRTAKSTSKILRDSSGNVSLDVPSHKRWIEHGQAVENLLSAAHFHSEEAAYAYVEGRLWPDDRVCPHCGASKEQVGRLWGKTNRISLCKCYACRKPFTVKIGTVFQSSHVPMRVSLQAIYLFCSSKKGISTRQLQCTFQSGMKTAWFLGHRVREAMADLGISDDSDALGGQNKVIESDETFIGGKPPTERAASLRSLRFCTLAERDGRVRSFHVPNVTAQTLRPIITANVDRASCLMTDESPVCWSIGRQFAGSRWRCCERGFRWAAGASGG
jgi:transposase-like protein